MDDFDDIVFKVTDGGKAYDMYVMALKACIAADEETQKSATCKLIDACGGTQDDYPRYEAFVRSRAKR